MDLETFRFIPSPSTTCIQPVISWHPNLFPRRENGDSKQIKKKRRNPPPEKK
jgi:hypothetical protein